MTSEFLLRLPSIPFILTFKRPAMSGLIRDTRDQPGLELAPIAHPEEVDYHQHETKDAPYISELSGASAPRICGFLPRIFWIGFVLVLVALGAAIGGGLGGGLSAAHKGKIVPTPTVTSPVSLSSGTATSPSPSAPSASSTSSAIAPFSTQPGTYIIVNIATNTAVDLYLGGTTNGTEIEGW